METPIHKIKALKNAPRRSTNRKVLLSVASLLGPAHQLRPFELNDYRSRQVRHQGSSNKSRLTTSNMKREEFDRFKWSLVDIWQQCSLPGPQKEDTLSSLALTGLSFEPDPHKHSSEFLKVKRRKVGSKNIASILFTVVQNLFKTKFQTYQNVISTFFILLVAG